MVHTLKNKMLKLILNIFSVVLVKQASQAMAFYVLI